MIYPKDIKSKQFSKSIAGYKTEEVDLFLDEVCNDYTKMLTDNAELVKKIEVVVAKLEEYRTNEESISNALLNAQKINEQVVREGKNKADLIIREATFKAERLIKNAHKEVEKEQEALDVLRKEVSNFRTRLFSIYRSHLDLIDSLPSVEEEESDENAERKPNVTPKEEKAEAKQEAPTEKTEEKAVEQPAEKAEDKPEEEEVNVFSSEEAAAGEKADSEKPEEKAKKAGEEAEDMDDGQLFFGGAAERFKDVDIKFGSGYDYNKK